MVGFMNFDRFVIDVEQYRSREHLAACLGVIDLTSLNATDTYVTIEEMARKVNVFSECYPGVRNVAAVCVYPVFAGLLRKKLTAKGVNIAVTGAGFPASQTFLKVKVQECRMAVEEGADEVDIVLSLNHFLSGAYNRAADEIGAIKEAIGHAHLKVIIESGALHGIESGALHGIESGALHGIGSGALHGIESGALHGIESGALHGIESGALHGVEAIAHASRIAMEAGADFIKTSTGKSEPAATPEAAVVMCGEILKHYQKRGKRIGFKPAGGIVTPKDALTYYAIVHHILGPEWLTPTLFRIGASRLANNLLSEILGTPTLYF